MPIQGCANDAVEDDYQRPHHEHGGGHDHGHSHDDESDPVHQSLIWKQIDFDKIQCLNEQSTGSGRAIVKKQWKDRMVLEPELVSDTDEQLLLFIPLTGTLKLHSILIRASDSPACPMTLSLFHNRDDLDFSTASESNATQRVQVARSNEVQEIPVKRAAFNNTHNLTIFIEDNHSLLGSDTTRESTESTRISYIGMKGEWKELNREPVHFLYEKAANPRDHKLASGIGAENLNRPGV